MPSLMTLPRTPTQAATWDQAERLFFLRCRAANLSQDTLSNYEWAFKSLRAFLDAHGSPGPADLDGAAIRAYLAELKASGKSSETVDTYFRRLRTFLGWLASEGVIAENPVRGIAKPRVERRLVRAFTPAELKALLDAIPKTALGARDTALILLLADSGARISEALGIRSAAVDFSSNTAVVMGKGRKERRIVFGSTTRKALLAWLRFRGEPRPDDALFCDCFGRQLTRNAVRIRLKRLTQKAGIAADHLSAHALRHAFAVNFLKGGGEVASLQRLLGHSTPAMSLRYCNMTEEDAMERARAVGVLDRMGIGSSAGPRLFR